MSASPGLRLKRLGALCAVAALGIAAGWLLQPKPVPDITLTTIQGGTIRLRGQPVLLVFWATDCPACMREVPMLLGIQRDYAPRGLKLVAVAMPYDPPNRVVAFARTHALTYPVVLDPAGILADRFAVRLIPSLVLIAPDGTRILRHTGPPDEARLRGDIATLLERGAS